MLHRNLEWKLAALVLAFSLWAYVTVTEQVGEKAFRVAIQVTEVPKGLALTSPAGDAVIWLRGEREALDAAAGRVQARAYPLANQPGTVKARVKPLSPPELIVVKVVPSQINLRLERIVKKYLPITCQLEGSPSPGYLLGEPKVSPMQARISGPESAVARAARLIVRVETSYATLGQPQSGLLEPVEAGGRRVPSLTVDPQTVIVTVPVTRTIASKLVPVFLSLAGEAREGFQARSISVTPPLVTVAGDAARIDALHSISTLPFSLNGASSSFSRRVALVAPEGVASISAESVLAKVEIAPLPAPEKEQIDLPAPPPDQQ